MEEQTEAERKKSIEKMLALGDYVRKAKQVEKWGMDYSKMSEQEKELYELTKINLERQNRKLSNEWWHLLLAALIGSIMTIATTLTSEYLRSRVMPKEQTTTHETVSGVKTNNSNQKGTSNISQDTSR